ncbi:hypothetical protein FAGAP_7889, partial [Fusarium agapanthi]
MPPQLDGSMFSVKNENNVGLANLSVDFSLVKVEVPKQFEGLGKALSPHRRENAERGPQHRTARRLGALFEQVIPDIEVLAAAYGERVSEIAESRQLDLNGEEYGPFSRYAGVDGTSIYAAASSGSGVIALHLLACMLARMLKDAEATAFWVQLVKSRLEELESKADPTQIHGIAALYTIEHGRQITRDDLAAWDASARAWLDIATEAKKWETTQLRLILNNIPPIKEEKDIHKFWIVAMTSIQKSIQGVPQDITNSVVLLGLMSWHIYPDLHVFSPNQFISFHDPLVKEGGIITLGLEQKGENTSGISWSISLSHLRFYGDPVTIKKSSDEDSDRITIQELQLIAFGGVLGSWANPAMVDINEAAECFDALGAALQFDNSTRETSYDAPLGWLAPLIAAARFFLLTVDKDRESALYFINFGRRRGRNLLGNDLHGAVPMFGLSNPYFNFRFLMEPEISCDNPTQYITRLRQLAEDCNFHTHDSVIVTGSSYSTEPADADSDQFEGNWEFASAIPTLKSTSKRSLDGALQVTRRHSRWVHIDRTRDPYIQRYFDIAGSQCNTDVTDWPATYDDMDQEETSISALPACNCRAEQQNANRYCQRNCPCQVRGFHCTSACLCLFDFNGAEEGPPCVNVRNCVPQFDPGDEDCFWLATSNEYADINITARKWKFVWKDPPHTYRERHSDLLRACVQADDRPLFPASPDISFGSVYLKSSGRLLTDSDTVSFESVHMNSSGGLFLNNQAVVDIPSLCLPKLTSILRSESLDVLRLRNYLEHVPKTGILDCSASLGGVVHHSELFFKSLKAMAAVSNLYAEWPEAIISVATTKKPLGSSYWASNVWNHSMLGLDGKLWRSTKFSCLTMLESGGHDIHPDQINLVIAMATGNSIYASEALLQDPSLPDNSSLSAFQGIRRLTGNVGYPGVVLLIPPPMPRVLQVDETRGRFVQAYPFDGTLHNSFAQTSIHLKFTEFVVPLASARGAVDADVVLREALISVYDGSRWIADLDILQAFESPDLIRMQGCNCTRGEEDKNMGELLKTMVKGQLKTISTWDELLLCRENLLDGERGAFHLHLCLNSNFSLSLAMYTRAFLSLAVGLIGVAASPCKPLTSASVVSSTTLTSSVAEPTVSTSVESAVTETSTSAEFLVTDTLTSNAVDSTVTDLTTTALTA